MSSFPNGRRPNMTNFMENLNVVSSNEILPTTDDENSNILWTNASFNGDYTSGEQHPVQDFSSYINTDAFGTGQDVLSGIDFDGDFFGNFTETTFEPQPSQTQFVNSARPAPIETSGLYQSPSSAGSPTPQTASDPINGSHHPKNLTAEEISRNAAEEDKRRRNTAASARFRVKKKAKEAALEKENKDRADKLAALERTISKLEMENKWLKELVLDRKLVDGDDEKMKEAIAKLMKGHREQQLKKAENV